MIDNYTLVTPSIQYLIKYLEQEIPKYKDSDEEYKQIIHEDLIRTKMLQILERLSRLHTSTW